MKIKISNPSFRVIFSLSIILNAILFNNSIEAREVFIPNELRHITIADGLIHNGVGDIVVGPKGYIWIATYDGLQRYDGKSFKTYKNTTEKSILPTNRIRRFSMTPDSVLWIGTDKGVAIYNQPMDSFTILPKISNSKLSGFPKKIKRIISMKAYNRMICALENGGDIWQYDLQGNPVTRHELIGSSPTMFVSDGEIFDDEHILWCTSHGVIMYDIVTGESKLIFAMSDIAYSIVKVSKDQWIVSHSNGIQLLNISLIGKEKKVRCTKITHWLLGDTSVRTLYVDSHFVWVGTFNDGVIFLDKQALLQGKVKKYGHLFHARRISKIFKSGQDYVWVTTFDDGIFQMSYQPVEFKAPTENKVTDFLNEKLLTQLTPWDSSTVLMRNGNGKVMLYDTEAKKQVSLPKMMRKIDHISSVCKVDQEKVWVQDGNIIYKLNLQSGTTHKYTLPKRVSNYLFLPIQQPIQANTLWLENKTNLCRLEYNPKSDRFTIEYLTSNPSFDTRVTSHIRSTYYDKRHQQLWIGTDTQGVYIVDLVKGQHLRDLHIRHLKGEGHKNRSLPSDFVSSVVGNSTIGLWVGTEQGGICQVNRPKWKIENQLTEKDGLCNDVIKAMQIDKKDRIWIGTNVGLSCLDPRTNKLVNYDLNDGLPFLDFQYESCQLSNGKIIMSGGHSICIFSPENLPETLPMPNFVFGELVLLNKPIQVGEKIHDRILLKEQLSELEQLNLKYNENILSIDLNVLDYRFKHTSEVKYQLLPLSREWVQLPKGQDRISLSGLNPNHYTLRVKISDSKGNWSDIKSLSINIARAPWDTWWAWTIYIVFFASIIYALLMFILRLQKLRYKVFQEERELEQAHELNEAKSRYFTNISHELKTPLTLISAPVQILMNQFRSNESVRDKLRIVERQSKKMLQLINMAHGEELDQANLLERHDSIFMVNRFVLELIPDFFFIAQVEGKHLHIRNADQHLYIQADHSQLETIINNLLNNAFKHTSEGDTITFDYGINADGHLFFSVEDTGHGIPEAAIDHIFDRFYQAQNKETINAGGIGIGLSFSKRLVSLHKGTITVRSKEGIGTTFTVVLPVMKQEVDQEVIKSEESALSAIESISLTDQIEQKAYQSESYIDADTDLACSDNSSLVVEDYNLTDLELDATLKEKVVYLVEDNAEMRQFIESVLLYGFTVHSFSDAPSCLEALKKTWPDIIVSDVMMPQMDGYEFCHIVKSDIKTSHIPVVLLTACGTLEEKVKGVDEGADAYISKPFHPKFLLKRVASILEIRDKLHERYHSELPTTMQEESKEEKYMDFLQQLYHLFDLSLSEENVDFSRMALDLGMNRTHFYQQVKDSTGDTPFELLKKHRIKRAAEYLLNGESVSNASLSTGFKSRTHFTKVFKETYGVSPSKYAQHIKSQISD